MAGESQAAGTSDGGKKHESPKFFMGLLQKLCQRLLNIGIMPFVVGKKYVLCIINNGCFYSGGTDIDS